MWKRILLVGSIAAVLLAALVYSQQRPEAFRVSGYIEADEIRVGSRVGGRVLDVPVEEGDRVHSGDLLLTLEPYDLLEQQAQAAAELAQRRADYDRLTAGYRSEEQRQVEARVEQLAANLEKLENGPRPEEIRAAELEVEQAQAQLNLAQFNKDRIERLFAKQAASKEELDQATSQLAVGQTTLSVRQETLKLLREGTRREEIDEARAKLKEAQAAADLKHHGYRTEEIAEAKAAVDAAEATLQAIKRRIEELEVRAPADAVVQAVDLQPGDLVNANAPAISLLDTSELWVRAYIPEDRLDVQTGQKVWVTVDSFHGETFAAHISYVSPEAEFTPRNVQTPEERSQQVFRIKATLDEGLDKLRKGMAADVWLEKR